jgi:hypothetical protein
MSENSKVNNKKLDKNGNEKRNLETTLRVIINWNSVGVSQSHEIIEHARGVSIFLSVIEKIAKYIGESKFRELLKLPVKRGMLLSETRSKYHRNVLLGYYVLTCNTTTEKVEILNKIVNHFHLPDSFLEIQVLNLEKH